ncbi:MULTISPECIES: alpha/beta hydrolase [Variovorax]|uniref:alpha/beta hydrolase n=1 Tax=Variovorax TaxID=34072 RepID=UPI0021AC4A1D|nr:alpha/beta hydrolase [Variovorax paradoxus]UVH57968.1 alpha/beta hydrolase [Variovorax paradoxus]
MKIPNIIAAAVLLLLAASGVQAQGFEPVQPLKTVTSRSDVVAGADAAARGGNVYGDVVAAPLISRPSSLDRASVRAEAVAAAHAPNQNLDRRAFVNSEVPPQFQASRR